MENMSELWTDIFGQAYHNMAHILCKKSAQKINLRHYTLTLKQPGVVHERVMVCQIECIYLPVYLTPV
jgi:hypothetical protein